MSPQIEELLDAGVGVVAGEVRDQRTLQNRLAALREEAKATTASS